MYAEPGKGAIHGAKDLRHGDVYLRLGFILTAAQLSAQNEEWTRPFPGHRVISNLYAVGTYGQGFFLITTDEGHILINTGLEDSTPLIRENIEAVGFKLEDVKILLTMQAHWDHTAALAEIKQITGANNNESGLSDEGDELQSILGDRCIALSDS